MSGKGVLYLVRSSVSWCRVTVLIFVVKCYLFPHLFSTFFPLCVATQGCVRYNNALVKTVFQWHFSLLNDWGVFHATEITFQTWRHFEINYVDGLNLHDDSICIAMWLLAVLSLSIDNSLPG